MNTVPIVIRSKGLDVELNTTFTSFLNDSFSIFELKSCKPINKTPKPATISPKTLKPFFFDKRGIAPTNAKKARYGVMFKDESETINVVIVVPMLAPIIHAQAWNRVIKPMSAKRTSVTAVTSDDCTTAECAKPVNIQPNLLFDLKPLVKTESLRSVA